MKKLSSIIYLTLILGSCGSSPKNHTLVDDNDDKNNIFGKWVLTVKQVNYPSIIFNTDSTAIFNSMGDTIYRYKYFVSKSVLILEDINGKTIKDKILKLDRDSLIFETLADNQNIQKYIRK